MMLEGGRFVRLLFSLARHADAEKLAKINATWPEYWAEYQAIGSAAKATGPPEKRVISPLTP